MNRLRKVAFDGQDTNIPPVVAREYYSSDALATEPTKDTRRESRYRRGLQTGVDFDVTHNSVNTDHSMGGPRNNGGFVGKFTPNPNYATLGIGPLGYVRFSGDPVTGWANWHYANQYTDNNRRIPYEQFLQDTNYMWEQTQRARANRWGVPYDKNKTYAPLHRKGSKYYGSNPFVPLPLSMYRAMAKVYPGAATISKPSQVTYKVLPPWSRGYGSVGGLPGGLSPEAITSSTLFHEGVASGHHATPGAPGANAPWGSLIPGMLNSGDSSLSLGQELSGVDGDGYDVPIDPAIPESASSYYSHISELSGLNDRLKKMLVHNGYKAPALRLAQPPATIGPDRVTDPLSALVATGAVSYDPRTGYYSIRSRNYGSNWKFNTSRKLVTDYDLRSWLSLTNRVAYLQRRVNSGYATDEDRKELQHWRDTLTDNYEVH